MTAQPLESPAPQHVSARRPFLRIVRNAGRPAPWLPFVLLVVAILGVGLAGVLFLSTQRAQASFRLSQLARSTAALQDQQQSLQRQVEHDQDPATLAGRAAALGMVPGLTEGYLAPDGKVIGPVPAGAPVPAPKASAAGGIVVAGSAPPPSDPPAAETGQ